jgi:hypothetical protein
MVRSLRSLSSGSSLALPSPRSFSSGSSLALPSPGASEALFLFSRYGRRS